MPFIIRHGQPDASAFGDVALGFTQQMQAQRRRQEIQQDEQALMEQRAGINSQQEEDRFQRQLRLDLNRESLRRRETQERAAIDVQRAEQMLPIQQQKFEAETRIRGAAEQQAQAQQQAGRREQFAGIRQQLAANKPAHVPDWMLDLAEREYAQSGRVSRDVIDLMRPRTPQEQADEGYKAKLRDAELAVRRARAEQPAAQARIFRETMRRIAQGPMTPQQEAMAQGLASGAVDLNDPMVRQQLGALTPAETASRERLGTTEPRLAAEAMRRQLEADPQVRATFTQFREAERVYARVLADDQALDKDKRKAEELVMTARERYLATAEAVGSALRQQGFGVQGGPGMAGAPQAAGGGAGVGRVMLDADGNAAPVGGAVAVDPERPASANGKATGSLPPDDPEYVSRPGSKAFRLADGNVVLVPDQVLQQVDAQLRQMKFRSKAQGLKAREEMVRRYVLQGGAPR
jgi:hypothetical protein